MEKGVFRINGIFLAATYSEAFMGMMGLNCSPPLKATTADPMNNELSTIQEDIRDRIPCDEFMRFDIAAVETLLYSHDNRNRSTMVSKMTYQKSLKYCGSKFEMSDPRPKRSKKSEVVLLNVYL